MLAEGPRGRKEYGITDTGRAELHHWLIDVEPKQTARSDLLLRVFFLDQVDPAEAGAYLEWRATEAVQRHELVALDKTVSAGTEPLALYGRLALEWGLRFTTTQREWAEWAAEQVRAMNELRD